MGGIVTVWAGQNDALAEERTRSVAWGSEGLERIRRVFLASRI